MNLLRKMAIFVIIGVTAFAVMYADGKLSIGTYAFLDELQNETSSAIVMRGAQQRQRGESVRRGQSRRMASVKTIGGKKYVEAFVRTDGWNVAPVSEMEALGVKVNTQVGNVLTVTVPVENIEALSELKNVDQVAVARSVRLLTNEQRSSANVDKVIAGTDLPMPYTGKGVVIGVIDAGIDFNHMAFKDANGNTRIKRVYMPGESGKAPVVNGNQLPGAEYTTADEIAKLTTDLEGESHGTHTSAIAGGTKVGNFGGMAPDADLVLCGMGNELSDASILNAVNYVFDYAKSVGKPAVINMSLGDHVGPHDGTTDFSKSLDELASDGRILVLAAGNEGNYAVHFFTTFENAGSSEGSIAAQNAVILKDAEYEGGWYDDQIEIYSGSNKPFYVQYVVFDANGRQLATSPRQTAKNSGVTFNMSTHSAFSKYYTGTAKTYSALDNNSGKFNVYIDLSCQSKADDDTDWYLGILFYGVKGEKLNGWDAGGYTDFTNLGKSDFINGDSEMSISGMATGKNIISVGAYVTKDTFKSLSGGVYSYGSQYVKGEVADFSSYGPDANGIRRPEVLAGGIIVVSAVNNYDESTVNSSNISSLSAEVADKSGKKYYWGDMAGTSMAAPEVAGIVALWLQANPDLNNDEIKKVLENTSVRDAVVNRNEKKSGYGKIDAFAGLKYVLSSTGIEDVKINDNEAVMLYPNPSDGDFSVFVPGEDAVNVTIYSMNGTKVYDSQVAVNGAVAEVPLAGKIASGAYIVVVRGDKVYASSRMMVK